MFNPAYVLGYLTSASLPVEVEIPPHNTPLWCLSDERHSQF